MLGGLKRINKSMSSDKIISWALVINALVLSNVTGKRSIVVALGICIIHAISDELHQVFIPGRNCAISQYG